MSAVADYYRAGRRLRAAVQAAQHALAHGGRRPLEFSEAAQRIHPSEVDRWINARAAVQAQIARAFPDPAL